MLVSRVHTRETDVRLRDFIHQAVEHELQGRGRAIALINDNDRLTDLGIDSLGVLRLYLRLQEYPGADLSRIADDPPPASVADLVALGTKAIAAAD